MNRTQWAAGGFRGRNNALQLMLPVELVASNILK